MSSNIFRLLGEYENVRFFAASVGSTDGILTVPDFSSRRARDSIISFTVSIRGHALPAMIR